MGSTQNTSLPLHRSTRRANALCLKQELRFTCAAPAAHLRWQRSQRCEYPRTTRSIQPIRRSTTSTMTARAGSKFRLATGGTVPMDGHSVSAAGTCNTCRTAGARSSAPRSRTLSAVAENHATPSTWAVSSRFSNGFIDEEFLECFAWCSKGEGLAGSGVEFVGDGVEGGLVVGDLDSLGEVSRIRALVFSCEGRSHGDRGCAE